MYLGGLRDTWPRPSHFGINAYRLKFRPLCRTLGARGRTRQSKWHGVRICQLQLQPDVLQ